MTKAKYDSLVDYTALLYVQTYIEYCISNKKAETLDIEDYQKNLKDTLDLIQINGFRPDSLWVDERLSPGWGKTKDSIFAVIHKRKQLYRANQSDLVNISAVVDLHGINRTIANVLQHTKDSILGEIQYIPPKCINKSYNDGAKNTENSSIKEYAIGGVLGFVFFVFIYKLAKVLRKGRDEEEKSWDRPKSSNYGEENSNNKIRQLQKEIEELKKENATLKKDNVSSPPKGTFIGQSPIGNSNPPVGQSPLTIGDNRVSSNSPKYLKYATNGKFGSSYETPDGCFFRYWENDMSFEFYGDETVALANINATFDNVCDYMGDYNTAKRIIPKERGYLSSDLRVKTKAKIFFES
jgi:hypothetical protein